MARKRQRKSDIGSVSADLMERAVKLVVEEKHSIRQTCKETGIPKTTLLRYINKFKESSKTVGKISFKPKYASRQVFSNAEEMMLEDYIINASRLHHGLAAKTIRRLAYEFGVANSRKLPDSWTKNQLAGEDWLWHFRRRHPNLSLRQPEATSLTRATSFNRHNISIFFKNLKTIYERFHFGPEDIYNIDESGLTTCHKPSKIIAEKGVKQVGKVTSAERGKLVTICVGVNALGNSIPPFFVFPRVHFKNFMLNGAPVGSAGSAHPSGWMTAENFLLFMEHFIKYTKCTKEKPVLLLLDNHESHVSIPVLDLAKNNGVHMLTFHPHTSHKMQPLDRSVFGPFKNYYNKAADSMMMTNPGKPITIYDISKLAGVAFSQALTKNNITKGFQVAGIWPYNDDIFEDHEFMSSFVTDQPNPQVIGDNLTPSVSSIQPPVTEIIENPTVQTPEKVRPFPKAEIRKLTIRRKKGSSRILTDSPVKHSLEEEAQQKAFIKQKKGKNAISKAKKKLRMQIHSDSDEDCPAKQNETESFSNNDVQINSFEPENIKVGSYVLVKFSTKKNIVYYVGLIIQKTDKDYIVRFMRKKSSGNQFFFPETIDECIINVKDIIMILPDPNMCAGTSRMNLTNMSFSVSLADFNIR